MSVATIRVGAPAAASGAGTNPWLIAIVVALASFMEVLDTTIANVALPYIAGGMGVSEDEASWVVTTYLVSNAIILTASSFLARMLGRKLCHVSRACARICNKNRLAGNPSRRSPNTREASPSQSTINCLWIFRT
jgi:hypothetical protein